MGQTTFKVFFTDVHKAWYAFSTSSVDAPYTFFFCAVQFPSLQNYILWTCVMFGCLITFTNITKMEEMRAKLK